MVQTPSASDTVFGLDISGARKTFLSLRRKVSKRYLLLEFGIDSLTYGEARVIKDQVYFSKVNRISIDQSAIERGSPTDAEAMASFLTQIIEEDQIWAHRVAITLPPQAALSKIIYLPEQLDYKEAIEYISNPSSSGFQFPISIERTDFDLIPLDCLSINKKHKTRAYFLNSIPKKLIDNIIKTLSNANLELHSLDIAYSSIERLAYDSISKLKINQVIILLELSLECTHIYIISKNGPIYVSTLAAIKAFEVPVDHTGSESIEESTTTNDDYLPVSDLDLKVLLSEIRKEVDQFNLNYKLEISGILLSGLNSSHPDINNIFEEHFNIKTKVLRSLSSIHVSDVNSSKSIIIQDLNRLVGLGLSMIQSDNIISDTSYSNSSESLNEIKIEDNSGDLNIDIDSSLNKKIDSDYESQTNNTKINHMINNESIIDVNEKKEFISNTLTEDKILEANNENIGKVSFDEFLNQDHIKKDKIRDDSHKQSTTLDDISKNNTKFALMTSKDNNDSMSKDRINQSINKEFILDFEAIKNDSEQSLEQGIHNDDKSNNNEPDNYTNKNKLVPSGNTDFEVKVESDSELKFTESKSQDKVETKEPFFDLESANLQKSSLNLPENIIKKTNEMANSNDINNEESNKANKNLTSQNGLDRKITDINVKSKGNDKKNEDQSEFRMPEI